jgi:adenosylcobinamide amidohydrolase
MFTSDVLHQQRGLSVARSERVLVMQTDVDHECLSFAPLRGGDTVTRLVANHSVNSDDLGRDVDATAFLRARHEELVGRDGVAMMTACALSRAAVAVAQDPEHGSVHEDERALADAPVQAVAVATVGLSNLLRVGDTAGELARVDTINVLLWVSQPLTVQSRLETLSVAAEARTTAVLERALPSRRSGLPATGTGTDCLALLSPLASAQRPWRRPYAGKHTSLGAVVGRVVYDSVAAGVAQWEALHGESLRQAMRRELGGPR